MKRTRVSTVVSIAVLCLMAGTATRAATAAAGGTAGHGTCHIEVSGDLTYKIDVTDAGKPPAPGEKKAVANATTDYWMTEAEMRQALAVLTGAFAGVGEAVKKKGAANTTKGDMEKAALGGAMSPSDAAKEKRLDEDMKKDPRLFLLLMNCGSDEAVADFSPKNGSKYANVPFKPARYKVVANDAAKPGDFVVLVSVKDGERRKTFHITAPGELELTQFDGKGIKGKFSFPAASSYNGSNPEKKVVVKGTFSYPCRGGSVCKN